MSCQLPLRYRVSVLKSDIGIKYIMEFGRGHMMQSESIDMFPQIGIRIKKK